jgi:hypothetical protein
MTDSFPRAPAGSARLSVNPAFFQEIKEDDRELKELLADLDSIAAGGSGVDGRDRRFGDMLAALRDRLAMHFALEEAYGYFADALQVEPRLAERAARLLEEHAALYTEASKLADEVEADLRSGAASQTLPAAMRRYLEFAARLNRHEDEECALIQAAFCEDIGQGD